MFTPAISKEVRDKFGGFYANGRDERPPEFKPYSIRNLLTQCTRIRLAILQVIGRRYKDSNQGSKVKVIGYDSRPILRITPPPDAQSRRVRTYNFIEAVQKYPTNFSKSDLEFILSKVGYKQKGQLRALFICLSDDMMSSFKRKGANDQDDQAQPSSDVPMDQDPPISQDQPTEPHVRPTSAAKSGNSSHSSRSGSNSSRSAQKRGAGSPASSHPEKNSRT